MAHDQHHQVKCIIHIIEQTEDVRGLNIFYLSQFSLTSHTIIRSHYPASETDGWYSFTSSVKTYNVTGCVACRRTD